MGSKIFKFIVGPNKKEFSIHEAVLSAISKPLKVMLNGPMKEAKEARVEWPDVDDKTFVRFSQWAYTGNYVAAEPDIVLDHSLIPVSPADPNNTANAPEQPLYCLSSVATSKTTSTTPPNQCPKCASVSSSRATSTTYCTTCQNNLVTAYYCQNCGGTWFPKICTTCTDKAINPAKSPKDDLIAKFLDKSGTNYPTTTGNMFKPRKNTEGCEDYTCVFLCHAQLYTLGDKYDIAKLKQLSLHRLHATLKEFTLYPSRMGDLVTLAKYVFENTVPEDKIRGMINLYFACVIEDLVKFEGLKSLLEEVPDFAFGLIANMSERLA